MGKILEVKKINKDYENTRILDDISLSIDKGEFLVVMGQSGCGKSTLLYNVSGMDKPSQGEVFLENKEISKLSEKEISRIRLEKMGFIFQKPNLLNNMSIQENICFPAKELKKETPKEINDKSKKIMGKVGIEKLSNHDIRKVSGGQLQRAAICRALINEPQILFADEPTGALNSSTTYEIMNIFNEINENGTTIMMVTHDTKVAARAERIVYLEDGKIKNQIILGKYKRDEMEKREQKATEWLRAQGF